MHSSILSTPRFPGELVEFPFRRDLSADFPFIRLGLQAADFDEAVVPDFVEMMRGIPAYLEKSDGSEVHEFPGTVAGSIITLDDTADNNEFITILAEDLAFEGLPLSADYRVGTIAGSDYLITDVDPLTREITVSGTPATGTQNLVLYPYRNSVSTKVRLLKADGIVLASAGASGTIAGLRTRDQMQRIAGIVEAASTVGFINNSTGSATGVFTKTAATKASTISGATATGADLEFDSSNSPDARTSATTDGNTRERRLGVYKYMFAGRVYL